jgi:hypothetical protein
MRGRCTGCTRWHSCGVRGVHSRERPEAAPVHCGPGAAGKQTSIPPQRQTATPLGAAPRASRARHQCCHRSFPCGRTAAVKCQLRCAPAPSLSAPPPWCTTTAGRRYRSPWLGRVWHRLPHPAGGRAVQAGCAGPACSLPSCWARATGLSHTGDSEIRSVFEQLTFIVVAAAFIFPPRIHGFAISLRQHFLKVMRHLYQPQTPFEARQSHQWRAVMPGV